MKNSFYPSIIKFESSNYDFIGVTDKSHQSQDCAIMILISILDP